MTKPDFTPDVHSMKMEIVRLTEQLAKSNERVQRLEKILQRYESEQLQPLKFRIKELEVELKESEDDLELAQHELSSYENALEDIQSIFVDGDACPLFEPFNPRNLSKWLNKFAIEQQIKALEWLLINSSDNANGLHRICIEDVELRIEHLHKEQENG